LYFDHVRCPSCAAQFDPEKISSAGGAPACPACGTALDVRSLFGLASQWVDPDEPDVGIDDLVAGHGRGGDAWRTTHGVDPLAGQSPLGGDGFRPADEDRGPDDPGGAAVLKALRDLKRG
jgi:hypothetical protein